LLYAGLQLTRLHSLHSGLYILVGQKAKDVSVKTIQYSGTSCLKERICTVAKYYGEYVCVCVCLSIRKDISGTARTIFTNFCACCLWPLLSLPSAG